MHGTIGLESREGDGSTFWFEVTLPLASASQPGPTFGKTNSRPPSAGEAGSEPAHLLLVDDGVINREIAQLVLEAMDYRITTADNGQKR